MTRKRGQPTKYTPDLADEILHRIAEGENLRAICAGHDLGISTVTGWAVRDVEGFAERYDQALKMRSMLRAEEIVEISDADQNDVAIDKKGKPHPNKLAVQRARLRVDTRKWIMAREHNGRYGNKIELGGKDGGPVKIEIVRFGDGDPPAG